MSPLAVSVLLLCAAIDSISGHGRMMDPPNRSSLWRTNTAAPPNYNDDQNNCGGKPTQWNTFGGKCGVCGDQYDAAHPQANENTGTYGTGIIVAEYTAGSVIDVGITLTTNHMGYFNFSLCVLEDANAPESGEDCFQPLTLEDGSAKYQLPNTGEGGYTEITIPVQLPAGLTCERCVFRWHYNAGNNWGDCGDGTEGMGCGEQETFRSCADVAIN